MPHRWHEVFNFWASEFTLAEFIYYYYYFGWIYFNHTITLQECVSFNFLEAIKTTLRHSYLISEPNLTEPRQSSYTNDLRKGITSSNQRWCLLWPPTEYRHSAMEKPKPKPEDISSWRNNIAIGSFYLPQHTCTFARELSVSKDKRIPWLFPENRLPCQSPSYHVADKKEGILVPRQKLLWTIWSAVLSWRWGEPSSGPDARLWLSKQKKAASTFPGEACL